MSALRGIRNACLLSLALWVVIIVGALALAGCEDATEYGGSAVLPPAQYQVDASSFVRFGDRVDIQRECTGRVGNHSIACATIGGGSIWIENPCDVYQADRSQHYAALLCHELGHVNGWPADHVGDKS